MVALSSPSQAATLNVTYRCVGGVAGTLPVELEAGVTPKINSAGQLEVGWSLKYLGDRRFGSPGFFAEGSLLSLEGVVDITGAWNGSLHPKGGKEQELLVPGTQMTLPEGLSDAGFVQRPGKIRVKPGALVVRFTPAQGEVMVNNHRPAIEYTGGWSRITTEEEFGDHLNDLHTTTAVNEVAKLAFTGTQVEYIGRRERDLSPIRIRIDGQPITDPLVEPGKDVNGTPMTGTKAKEVLWTSPEMAYKPHTIEVENTAAGRAYLDAFKVITGALSEPPKHHEATCTITSGGGSIDVDAPGTPSSPPPTTPTPTGTPTGTNSPTNTPTTTPPNNNGDNNQDPWHVGVVPGAVKTPTTRASASPTTTRFIKAQVVKTPKGGVDTGEAPAEATGGPYGLIAGGSALLLVSATGGLLVRRRRAAHAGGAK
ncbi:hypothetical protein ACIBHY_41810 [Nonomuraea sp. NPDC050547]|uniref:hypothetical protein n=1 Tax=Nonomuraea sp. NPDC050547 TaxID=3364368 RepID=UPI0037AEFC28